MALMFGTRTENITPKHPVSLAGYFTNRVSKGILDRLKLRVLALSDGINSIVIVQIDTCFIPKDFADSLRATISMESYFKADEIMIIASHTHTGPSLNEFFNTPPEPEYRESLKESAVKAIKNLHLDKKVYLKLGRLKYDDLCYNRRWFMKNGFLLTNPPKGHPDLLRPEGPVDRELQTIFFVNAKSEKVESIIANISNHTDTIGGDMISADWPGVMEREVNRILGSSIPVIPAIAPAGNINHFNFWNPEPQTSYDVCKKIGKTYADLIIESLKGPTMYHYSEIIKSSYWTIDIPARDIPESTIKRAEEILHRHRTSDRDKSRSLTAEDLARGSTAVSALFAGELIKYFKTKKERYRVPLQTFILQSRKEGEKPVALPGIPGEPFVEIGLDLKSDKEIKALYSMIVPISLANGYYGYIPLKQHFKNGGYEVLTTRYNCLNETAGEKILGELKRALRKYIHEINQH